MIQLLSVICSILLGSTADVSTTDRDRVLHYWNSISDREPIEPANADMIESLSDVDVEVIARSHRVYVISRSGGIYDRREVVVVSNSGSVFSISSVPGFNQMLAHEGIRTDSAEAADKLARAFVRVQNCGWKGIVTFPLLRSVEDIPFKDGREEERDALIAKNIGDPSVISIEEGFRFTAYSWSSQSGEVVRVVVDVARGYSKVLGVRYDSVADEVGDFGDY